MALLAEVLFPPADYRRTTLSTIIWWESRRSMFNVIVGGTGLITLAAIQLISVVPPGLPMHFDWRPVAAYGVLANVCYTFGSGIELLLQRVMGRRAPAIGPLLFRQGLAFSVGLTLLPIVPVTLVWIARLAAFLVS